MSSTIAALQTAPMAITTEAKMDWVAPTGGVCGWPESLSHTWTRAPAAAPEMPGAVVVVRMPCCCRPSDARQRAAASPYSVGGPPKPAAADEQPGQPYRQGRCPRRCQGLASHDGHLRRVCITSMIRHGTRGQGHRPPADRALGPWGAGIAPVCRASRPQDQCPWPSAALAMTVDSATADR